MSESSRTFLENFDRGAVLTTGWPLLIEATTWAYSLGVFQYTGSPNVSRACFTVTSSPVPSRMTTTLTFLWSIPRWRRAARAAAPDRSAETLRLVRKRTESAASIVASSQATTVLDRGNAARIEVVTQVEHDLIEVPSQQVDAGLHLLGGEVAALDLRRPRQHPQPAGVFDHQTLEQRFVHPVHALEHVEDGVARLKVEERHDVGVAGVELNQQGALGRRLLREAHAEVHGQRGGAQSTLGREDRGHPTRLAMDGPPAATSSRG